MTVTHICRNCSNSGSLAACRACAQQVAMPVVGVLHSQSPEAFRDALRDLKDAGYVEGENVAIEYR